MDSRLNSIKDRIRALINRNKQIDTELENRFQKIWIISKNAICI